MTSKTYCFCCRGRKKILGGGMIECTCPECNGTGFMADEPVKEEPEAIKEEVKAEVVTEQPIVKRKGRPPKIKVEA
jgi:hypothetical protein